MSGETLNVLSLQAMHQALGGLIGTPCWALTRDRLILASQQAEAAQWLRDHAAAQPAGRSLQDNAAVQNFLAGHTGADLAWLRYINEAESIMPTYAQLGMFYGLGIRWVMEQEPRIRFGALPPADAIESHLGEAVSWGTVDGSVRMKHGRTGVPFITGTGGAYLAKVAFGTSILLPSLARARDVARRSVCAANLKGIGMALQIHAAADGHDRFPADLKNLVDSEAVSPRIFLCPSSGAKEGDLDACYVYITGQKSTDHPNNVLVYEKVECHGGEGANVLFVDGVVEFVAPPERIEELVRETRERLDPR